MGRFSTGGSGLGPGRSRVGTVLLGRWRLDEVLGFGGMAAVYAATHRDGTRAAIKILHEPLSRDPHVRGRFLREAHLARRVDHPGAVAILEQDVTPDGAAFLAMELLEGETLQSRWAERGTLGAPEVLAIADQLLDVLATAHDRGIVHRDLKPENVFLTEDGRVKVLDYGIARSHDVLHESELTQTGVLMGTPAFMPPEQVRGRWNEVDARSDLWAVGALMFSLLSGRFVHESEFPGEFLLACATEPARPLASVVPDVHSDVAALVDRALSFDPAGRWPNARAMQRAVREAARLVARTRTQSRPTLRLDALAFAVTADGSLEVPPASWTHRPTPPASRQRATTLPPEPMGFFSLAIAGATAALAVTLKVALACVLMAELATFLPNIAAAATRSDAIARLR